MRRQQYILFETQRSLKAMTCWWTGASILASTTLLLLLPSAALAARNCGSTDE